MITEYINRIAAITALLLGITCFAAAQWSDSNLENVSSIHKYRNY